MLIYLLYNTKTCLSVKTLFNFLVSPNIYKNILQAAIKHAGQKYHT